jgi:hypothetical protein
VEIVVVITEVVAAENIEVVVVVQVMVLVKIIVLIHIEKKLFGFKTMIV